MAHWLTLTDIFGFLGIAGTVIAVASTLIGAAAFGWGNPGLGWGGTVGWFLGLVLSLGNYFLGHWALPLVALVSLPVSLILTVVIVVLRLQPRMAMAGSPTFRRL